MTILRVSVVLAVVAFALVMLFRSSVPAARARPVIVSAALTAPRSEDSALGSSEALRDALIATLGDSDDCPRLIEYKGTPEMVIERLDEHHVLVQALCQMGAYNYSNGF